MKRINHGSELRNSFFCVIPAYRTGRPDLIPVFTGTDPESLFHKKKLDSRRSLPSTTIGGGNDRRGSFVIQSNHRAFSLLEIMLGIAIVAVIAVGVIMLDIPALQRNDLDTVRNSMIQTLHSARSKARAVDGDTQWGMSIQASAFVLFKGASYASRNASYDELTELPQTLIPSGLSEIVFAKRTGDPLSIGTITLYSKTNEQRTITINGKGTIDY